MAAGVAAAAAAKPLQSCPTLCDPIDGSPPGSPVPGILQARSLEWVAISFSNAWKWKVKVKSLSHVRLLVTPWTVAYQAPPSMGFSRQEYWSGVPLPSPESSSRFLLLLLLFSWLCWVLLLLELFSSAQASHYSNFSCCGAGAPGPMGFGSCGSQALEFRLNSWGPWAWLLYHMWDPPG